MTTTNITSRNVKSNILKILISNENKTLSQFDIYNRLEEIYNIDTKKNNTRSQNKQIKELVNHHLQYLQNHRDITVSIVDAILHFTYFCDETLDDKDDEESDDDDDSDYEYESASESDESLNNEENKVHKGDQFDIFEKLIISGTNKDFLDTFRDSNGNTVSHYLVSDKKYLGLISIMTDEELFHYFVENNDKKNPFESACPEICNRICTYYMAKISEDTSIKIANELIRIKCYDKLNTYTQDEVNALIYRTERNNIRQINRMMFLFFIVMCFEIYMSWTYLDGLTQECLNNH